MPRCEEIPAPLLFWGENIRDLFSPSRVNERASGQFAGERRGAPECPHLQVSSPSQNGTNWAARSLPLNYSRDVNEGGAQDATWGKEAVGPHPDTRSRGAGPAWGELRRVDASLTRA